MGELLTGLFEFVLSLFEFGVDSDSGGPTSVVRTDSAGKRDGDSGPTGAA